MVKTYFASLNKIENLLKNNNLHLDNIQFLEKEEPVSDLQDIQEKLNTQEHFLIKDFHKDLVSLFNNIIEDETQYINIVKNLGAGKYGKVILPEYEKEKLFVIKESKKSHSVLLNEAIVGFCLNELRNLIPHFIYSYSYFKCGEDDGHKICAKDKSNEYLSIEIIQNAKTMREKFLDLTYQEIVDVFLQIFSCLDLAQHFFKFVHYDLHNENIILEENKLNISIDIFKNGKKITEIKPKYIVRIIDFGMSRIDIDKNIIYQYKECKEFNSCFDIYKIFMFTYEDYLVSDNKNSQNSNLFRKIFNFFYPNVNNIEFMREQMENESYYEYDGNVNFQDLYNFYLEEI